MKGLDGPGNPKRFSTEDCSANWAAVKREAGTVLGSRANKAHKDHFHLDMKQRDRSLCR